MVETRYPFPLGLPGKQGVGRWALRPVYLDSTLSPSFPSWVTLGRLHNLCPLVSSSVK